MSDSPRRTVGLIDLLLKRAPRNLHFAAAFRFNPGLDLAAHILDGSAIIVRAREFRFSKPEIARFFRGDLSRRNLTAVEQRTAGWPVALMVYRNIQVREAGHAPADAASLTSNFVGVSLLRDLSAEDRTFLLDLAIFEKIEAGLVDEVLGSSDARLRIAALSVLDGLLLPLGHDGNVQRLHPLVQEYCIERFAVEDPVRKRSLHARIARALASRGMLAEAWGHASAASDSRLMAELIERVGVAGLWLRGGVPGLVSADRFLTREMLDSYPRLALLRCVVLSLSSKADEAAALYGSVARTTEAFTRDRDGGDVEALSMDRLFTQVALANGTGGLAPSEFEVTSWVGGAVAGNAEPPLYMRGARHALCCIASYERARFEESRRHGTRAHAHFREEGRFGGISVSICLGMAAMAQGRVQDAADWYRRARQAARKFFPSDPCLPVSIDVATIELDLERNREKAIQQRALQGMDEMRGGWIDIHAAAVAVRAELTFEQYGGEATIKLLTHAIDSVGWMRGVRLSRIFSALLTSYLAQTGRGAEAEYVWRDYALPRTTAEVVDLDAHSWRTMEVLSGARVRLLVGEGDFDAAGELANAAYRTATARGLVRTAMRSLALSMVVAHHANDPDLAVEKLVEFLGCARDVDYVRPLVRHREESLAVLQLLLRGNPDPNLREITESVLASLGKRSATDVPEFTSRELEILAEVRHGRRNKEIAERLGITDEGVRYHLKKIYRKIGVSRRNDAVHYVLEKGALS